MEVETNKIKIEIKYVIIFVLAVSIIVISFFSLQSYLDNKNIKNEKNIRVISEITRVNITNEVNEELQQIIKRKIPIWHENADEDVRQIYFSNEKQVYLTFDDGPSELTPQILDILKEEEVKATFFVLGSRVDLKPDILRREYKEGHYIANHGYTHVYSSIYSSPESVLDEYLNCEQSIKNALNNQEYNSYLFRFPGGSSGGKYNNIKAEAKALLKQNNIASTNWNCLNGDAEAVGRTENELIARLNQTIGDQKSLIVLMHDAADKQTTVNSLRQVIQKFKSEGYEFKNFYDIFK